MSYVCIPLKAGRPYQKRGLEPTTDEKSGIMNGELRIIKKIGAYYAEFEITHNGGSIELEEWRGLETHKTEVALGIRAIREELELLGWVENNDLWTPNPRRWKGPARSMQEAASLERL